MLESDEEERHREHRGGATSEERCATCRGHGEVILCDYCPKAQHAKCAGLKSNPTGHAKFACTNCGDDVCDTCRGDKAFIRCRYCRRTFHGDCVHRIPDVDDLWLCSVCQRDAGQAIDKILACRPYYRLKDAEHTKRVNAWVNTALEEGLLTADSGPGQSSKKVAAAIVKTRAEPEYLVRWGSRAYWHCSWVPESFLAEMARIKLKNFKQRQTESGEIRLEEDALDTEEELVINPSWLQVDRVLDERRVRSIDGVSTASEYFVKWVGLEYEESTWELKSDLMRKGFGSAVQQFHRREQDWARALEGNLGLNVANGDAKPTLVPLETQPAMFVGGSWHDYQLEGVNFLRNGWHAGNNVILADEMGLGKTIQAIGFLGCITVENKDQFKPHLIVCPLAVVDNWEREFKTWCPHLAVVVYKGSQNSRELIQGYEVRKDGVETRRRPLKRRRRAEPAAKNHVLEESDADAAADDEDEDIIVESSEDDVDAGDKRGRSAPGSQRRVDPWFHVLVTSFEFAARDAGWLRRIKWGCVVVDEGHRLKGGSNGKLYKALKEFDVAHRLILTGTPLQNSLEELFNLLHFLAPDKFAQSEAFTAEFASMDKEEQLAKLRDLIAPHMLRRLKKDVNLCIPEKHELVVRVELSEVQKSYYRLILTQNFEVLRKKFKAASSIYNMIMQLKKVCNHPFLMQDEQEAMATEDYDSRGTRLVSSSGKLELLDRMLLKLRKGGHRVLLFSQMTSMLDILEEYLNYRGWRYQRLDGSTKAAERQARIDAFNRSQGKGEEEQFVFLLSTRAGGLGINLTTADTVIIYDLDWNPHNDLQALARAHRIGQTKKVMIYRFLTRNSVEERILQLAKKKLLLEHVVVGEASRGRNLSQEELDDVLKYGAEELFTEDRGLEADVPAAHDPADHAEGNEALPEKARKWGDGNASYAYRKIIWDDEAVERLLDRNGDSNEGVNGSSDFGTAEGSKGGLGELFSSFKVATFATLQDREDGKASEVTGDNGRDDVQVVQGLVEEKEGGVTTKSWSDLLEKRFVAIQREQTEKLGKGKRERREVQRPEGDMNELQMLEDDSVSDVEDDDPDYYDEARWNRNRQRREKYRTNGTIPVPGFGEQQRRAIKSFLMQHGLLEGDWHAFSTLLMAHAKGRLGDRSMHDIKRYVTYLLNQQRQQQPGAQASAVEEGEVNGNGTAEGLTAANVPDTSLLKRIAVITLITEKVKEYEEREDEDFTIGDGRQTSWFKAVSFTWKSVRVNWTRERDLLLLRLVLKHGYGNWKQLMQDPVFLASLPQSTMNGSLPPMMGGMGMGAEEGEMGSGDGVVGGGDDDGEDGASTGVAEEPSAALKDGASSRQLLQLVTKRVKVMTHALAIERQKMQRRAEAVKEVHTHVASLAADVLKAAGEALPPSLPQLQEQQHALKARLSELYSSTFDGAGMEQKHELLHKCGLREQHQVEIFSHLRRLTTLATLMNNTRMQVTLGSFAMDRMLDQVKQLSEIEAELAQSVEQLTEHESSVQSSLRRLFGPSEELMPSPPLASQPEPSDAQVDTEPEQHVAMETSTVDDASADNHDEEVAAMVVDVDGAPQAAGNGGLGDSSMASNKGSRADALEEEEVHMSSIHVRDDAAS